MAKRNTNQTKPNTDLKKEERMADQVKDGGDETPDGVDVGRIEVEGAEGGHDVLVVGAVADRVDARDAALAQVVVETRIALQLQLGHLGVGGAEQELNQQKPTKPTKHRPSSIHCVGDPVDFFRRTRFLTRHHPGLVACRRCHHFLRLSL